MRLWSIHPKYLDVRGIVALWREGLLAQKVLLGGTKGYKNHPQLERFKKHEDPSEAIGYYLAAVLKEAQKRGFKFEKNKIAYPFKNTAKIKVPSGQISYEFGHLKKKLRLRDLKKHKEIAGTKKIALNPVFRKIKGGIASWERPKE